ncbi:hypothetical protein COCOBI_03-6580 [Coccomyxa sp. Obi]|nr:hypothetical protein COCOBI_03-6580 [Coccomyxa sp. Obi]
MKSLKAVLIVGLLTSLVAIASSRSLHEAPAQAPAPAEDAIVSIIDASGMSSATFAVADRSTLKVSSSGVTVVRPDGQAEAFLSLANGSSSNSSVWIQPSYAISNGFITISQPNTPDIKVSFNPAFAGMPQTNAAEDIQNEVHDYRLIG